MHSDPKIRETIPAEKRQAEALESIAETLKAIFERMTREDGPRREPEPQPSEPRQPA